MGSLNLTGTLSLGDCGGISSCGDASDTSIDLGFAGCSSRSFGPSVHVKKRTVTSPSAFVTLGEVGASATVTQGDFLFLRANAAVEVRLTTDDGAGGTTTTTSKTDYLLLTFPAPNYLELLEVKGSAQIEYVVSGPS